MTAGAPVPIRELRAAAYEIPTDAPESDGTLEWDSTVLVIAEASAGDQTGLGYTYAHQSAVPLITGKLAGIVEGRDALDVRGSWREMVHQVRNLGATGLVSMAISAVDIALWDLKARLLDLPLVVALDAVHDVVPVYGSGGFTSYDDHQLTEQLAGWVAAGIPRVKIKNGREPDRDHHRLEVARKAIGDDTQLYVDANGAFHERQAVDWARTYRYDFDVRWFEEPVSSDNLRGLRLVREQAPGGIDIAAGEYAWNPWYCQEMLAAGAVDCLQVDATRCLGLTGFLAAAGLCDAHQIDLSVHCAPQISAHAGVTARRLRHLEYFHDHVRIESMLFDGVLAPEPGGVLRPDRSRPGHGLALKPAAADRFRVA
ncbi:MAG TPA: enolase C-terminal domain-like protein [Mycobacteriales bacterium]|nr:enolase C-terminal domain-like protein [Mycobacteriales bacterium]